MIKEVSMGVFMLLVLCSVSVVGSIIIDRRFIRSAPLAHDDKVKEGREA